LKKKRRTIDKRIRAQPKNRKTIMSQKEILNSQMEDGSALSAKTIISRVGRNAIDARRLEQLKIFQVNQLI
jgi:hypothetical protein